MGTYKDLMELAIKREFGVLGREKTFAALEKLGLKVNEKGQVLNMPTDGKDVLGKFLMDLGQEHGLWAVLGAKITLLKAAREYNLELPEILRR